MNAIAAFLSLTFIIIKILVITNVGHYYIRYCLEANFVIPQLIIYYSMGLAEKFL